jgi:hypothetical protein
MKTADGKREAEPCDKGTQNATSHAERVIDALEAVDMKVAGRSPATHPPEESTAHLLVRHAEPVG